MAHSSSKRWLHCTSINYIDKHTSNTVSRRERNIAVTSYYNQSSIDVAAAKPSVRLTPATIMYSSLQLDSKHTALRSAQYLYHELPVRLAHRIAAFRSLPFIIGCNPTILSVHETYLRTFHILYDFPKIMSLEDVKKYDSLLRSLMDDHREVVTSLAKGFKECRKHIKDDNMVSAFLDRTLCSRLGIRMLVTHHLQIQDHTEGHIGMINLCMNLRDIVQRWANFTCEISEERYGHSPNIRIYGHTSAVFPYIELPLDYILPEILKNAVRATIENNPNLRGNSLPPIVVTLATNTQDFIIRISDRGGGVPHDQVEDVLKYNYTTAEDSTERMVEDNGIFGTMIEEVNRTSSGPMHGFGFGLPTSAAYAEYLGGNLTIQSMQGLGTDVYIRLKHLESSCGHQIRF